MKTIRNLTKSPYDLRSVDGIVRLPALGDVTAEFAADYLAILEKSRTVEVLDPLDHDGDGKKGGSLKPEATDDLVAVRAEYLAVVGKKPFHGWDAAELHKRIAAARAS